MDRIGVRSALGRLYAKRGSVARVGAHLIVSSPDTAAHDLLRGSGHLAIAHAESRPSPHKGRYNRSMSAGVQSAGAVRGLQRDGVPSGSSNASIVPAATG